MRGAKYVLLAEDNEDDTFFAARCFSSFEIPITLQRCVNGQEVVTILTECGEDLPALVILDLKMPRMDGFEVLQWIREEPRCKSLPVVILSSSPLSQDSQKAMELGATDYLVKPARLQDLKAMLSGLLRRIGLSP